MTCSWNPGLVSALLPRAMYKHELNVPRSQQFHATLLTNRERTGCYIDQVNDYAMRWRGFMAGREGQGYHVIGGGHSGGYKRSLSNGPS